MTFTPAANLVLEFRLMIEGWPYEFVSHAAMAKTTSDGRQRIAVLDRAGLGYGQRVVPYHATVEGEGMSVTLVDTQGTDLVTAALSTLPTQIMYLTADAGIGATFTVHDTTGWSAGDYFHIGTEVVQIGTVASSTSLTGCSRNKWNTAIQSHYTGDGERIALARATNVPTTMEGRRAFLYVYTNIDTLSGDGDLKWRGIVMTDPKLESDGATWTLTIDPITRLLEQDVGGDLEEPFAPRGIYYPYNAPLLIILGEADVATWWGVGSVSSGWDWVYGFYENEAELCDAINTALDGIITAASLTMTSARAYVGEGGQGIYIAVQVHASTPKYPLLSLTSDCDAPLRVGPGTPAQFLDSDGAPEDTAAAGQTYVTTRLRSTVPRGFFGERASPSPLTPPFPIFDDPAPPDASTWPSHRVYLAGARSVAALEAGGVRLSAPEGDTEEAAGFVLTANTTSRYVDFSSSAFRSAGLVGPYDLTRPMELDFRRAYGSNTADVYEFINNLQANAITEANRGGVPFIVSADLEDWSTVVDDSARGRAFLDSRRFIMPVGVQLAEYLADHFRALGIFPIVTADGTIDVRPLRPLTPSQPTVLTIDSDVMDAGSLATWERNAEGSINTVVFGLEYNAFEDEFRRYFQVRDQVAYSVRKSPRELRIECKSYESDPLRREVYRDLIDIADLQIATFGRDYAVVTVSIPYGLATTGTRDIQLGDLVQLSIDHLPDGAGGRGLSKVGLVYGLRVDFEIGMVRLDCIASYENIAGYAPSVYVSSESGSGTAWILTVTDNGYYGDTFFEDGQELGDHFAVGDEIRVWKLNTATPGIQTASVNAVSTTSTSPIIGLLDITFDSSWTPGADEWMVSFGAASAAVARQQLYAYLADSGLSLNFGTPTVAQVYA